MDNIAPPKAGTSTPSMTAPVKFTGRRWPLFKLVLKNVLLSLVTIGIYRFWAKTRVRRYFWSNIVIGGEPLEYTGRGLELLIGFFIVLVVLIPLSALQSGLGLMLGPEAIVVDILSFVVFLFLLQFALFRMWRYRLTRTRWRGIRFRLEGAATRYAVRAFLWLVAQAVTLGIVTPWARVDLMRYKMRRVNFGDTAFRFEGGGAPLLAPWLLAWGLPVLVLVFGVALAGSEGFAFLHDVAAGEAPRPNGFPWVVVVIPLAVLLFFALFTWYRVCEFRYMVGCVKFGDAAFTSRASLGRLTPQFLLAAGVFLALGAVVVGGIVALSTAAGPSDGMVIQMLIPLVVLLFIALFSPLITYPFVVFPIIRHVWTTLIVTRPDAFSKASQATERAPRFGEGLADAFDVGAF